MLDTPRTAGLIVVGAVVLLGLLRKGFGPVAVKFGD